jgi:hypothetical protein
MWARTAFLEHVMGWRDGVIAPHKSLVGTALTSHRNAKSNYDFQVKKANSWTNARFPYTLSTSCLVRPSLDTSNAPIQSPFSTSKEIDDKSSSWVGLMDRFYTATASPSFFPCVEHNRLGSPLRAQLVHKYPLYPSPICVRIQSAC